MDAFLKTPNNIRICVPAALSLRLILNQSIFEEGVNNIAKDEHLPRVYMYFGAGFTDVLQRAPVTAFSYDHPRPALTVDVVIFTLQEQALKVLLIQRSEAPFQGHWALPGGFVSMEESLEMAAARKLNEETGVTAAYLEQLYTYGDPSRDPRGRVVSVAYFALIPADQQVLQPPGSDALAVVWFVYDQMPPLAFDHDDIVRYAVRRLRYKLEYTAVGFELLPDEFTLSELQQTYEIILGEEIDKRNFRRRILSANVIEPTPYKKSGDGRPAQLYRYRPDAVAEVKARRLFP